MWPLPRSTTIGLWATRRNAAEFDLESSAYLVAQGGVTALSLPFGGKTVRALAYVIGEQFEYVDLANMAYVAEKADTVARDLTGIR